MFNEQSILPKFMPVSLLTSSTRANQNKNKQNKKKCDKLRTNISGSFEQLIILQNTFQTRGIWKYYLALA